MTTEKNLKLAKRMAPLLLVVAAGAVVVQQGWLDLLSLEGITYHRQKLQLYVSEHYLFSILGYAGTYIGVIALSLPGGVFLTILGGFLFGWAVAGAVTVVAATIGATIIFMIARTSLGEPLAARAGPWLDKLRAGFAENALSYLLFLRLVPAFPFWLVNLAPAFLGVTLPVYFGATLVGIIPGTFAFAFVGAGLDSIIAAQMQAFEACRAAGGQAAERCTYSVDPGSLLTPQVLAAFVGLGIIALVPIVAKRIAAARRDKNLIKSQNESDVQ